MTVAMKSCPKQTTAIKDVIDVAANADFYRADIENCNGFERTSDGGKGGVGGEAFVFRLKQLQNIINCSFKEI